MSPRLMQQQVLGWIEARIGDGNTVDELALLEHFPLIDARQMRAVLADLADAGKVTVAWKVEPFVVTLGRKASTFTPAKPMATTVCRREASGARIQVHPESVVAAPGVIHRAQQRNRVPTEDETADKIKRILARGKAAVAVEPVLAAKEIGPEPQKTATEGGVEAVEEIGAPAAFDRGAKPFIRAAVIREARRSGVPLYEFVTMLIDRGFDSLKRQAA